MLAGDNKILRSLILAGGLLMLPCAHGAERTVATWCEFDLPPMYIPADKGIGTGIVDTHVAFLMNKLPEYEHRVQLSNIARVVEQMRRHEQIVCAGMQKNEERESIMLFSEPFTTTAPPKVLLPRRLLDRMRPHLNSAGEVRLSETIEKGTLVLGLTAGRSYGRKVDDQLAHFAGHSNIVIRQASQDLAEGVARMIAMGRVDYTIGFTGEQRVLRDAASIPGAENELVALPIEGLPRYVPIYIVAPRDEWGLGIITRVNVLLRRHWLDPEFRKSLLQGQDAAARQATETALKEINPNNRR